MPKADIKLIEDGYPSAVARTGHGLQRAFILTMLQHLAVAQTESAQSSENKKESEESEKTFTTPNLVLE